MAVSSHVEPVSFFGSAGHPLMVAWVPSRLEDSKTPVLWPGVEGRRLEMEDARDTLSRGIANVELLLSRLNGSAILEVQREGQILHSEKTQSEELLDR